MPRLVAPALLLVLLSYALEAAAQPVVQTQARGKRRPVTVTVSGTVIDLPPAIFSEIRVGVANGSWTSVGGVDGRGAFRFRTELTEGQYAVVAVWDQFLVASASISVDAAAGSQSLTVTLRPESRYVDRQGAELHYDEPQTLPTTGLVENPDEWVPPPPPPPPPPGPGWSRDKNKVRVLYATNRKLTQPASGGAGPLENTEDLFAGEPERLRFGYYDVGVTFKRAAAYNPLSSDSYQFATYSIYLYKDAAGFSSGLADEIATRSAKDVLLFVHGYNTPFHDGIYRTAQLAVETGFQGVPVYFGWPGGERWWHYLSARDQVAAAATELATVLKTLAGSSAVARLHVVAHSLGNNVLVEAIDRLRQDPAFSAVKAANLVMAAPDVNSSRFGQVAKTMVSMFQRRTAYVSDTDWALRIGRVFNRASRIGQRTPLSMTGGFDTIDASGAKDTILGHSYFVDVDTIANDIAAVVVKGLTAAQRGLQQVIDNGTVVWQLPK